MIEVPVIKVTYKPDLSLNYPKFVATIVTGMVDSMVSIRRKEGEEKKATKLSRKKKISMLDVRWIDGKDVKHDTSLRNKK